MDHAGMVQLMVQAIGLTFGPGSVATVATVAAVAAIAAITAAVAAVIIRARSNAHSYPHQLGSRERQSKSEQVRASQSNVWSRYSNTATATNHLVLLLLPLIYYC
jgi:hypothetical protein